MMIKKLLAAFAGCLLISTNAVAQTTAHIPSANEVGAIVCPDTIAEVRAPFGMLRVSRPVFPSRSVNIAKSGAKKNVLCTAVIQKCIDKLSAKGGGRVIVPAGTWLTGRITLKDNVELHLQEGAVLQFSDKIKDYLPAVFTRNEGVELYSLGSLIYANGATNIALTGKGKLVGPGKENEIYAQRMDGIVIENFIRLDSQVEKRVFDGKSLKDNPTVTFNGTEEKNMNAIFLPMFFAPMNCKNVLVEGVTFENSIFWNIVPVYCENVIIRGCSVDSNGGRTDGIDIESSKNVLIEYVTLACGDDCFTIKSGRAEDGLRVNKASENIVIRYCLAQRGPGGMTIGSETAGWVRNVYMHDCVFHSPLNGFYFKTRRNRGGGGENMTFERIRMISPKRAFRWDMLGSPMYMGELANRLPIRPIVPLTPAYRHFTMNEILVEKCKTLIAATGIPESPVEDVKISNLEALCDEELELSDVLSFSMKNCVINSKK